MALRSTVFKAELQIADMDRGYYATHTLTLARHPSETDERMMMRVLAFALYAADGLGFGRGLSTDDEPDLWQLDLTGAIQRWIDVGLPDERRLRKAAGRSEQVVVLLFGGSRADIWWSQNAAALERLENLTVIAVPQAASQALARLAERSMTLHCTVQDGIVWFGSDTGNVELSPVTLRLPTAG